MKSIRTLVFFLLVIMLLFCNMVDSIVFPEGAGAFQGHEFEASASICNVCEEVIELCTCVGVTSPWSWQRPWDMLCDDFPIDRQHDSSLPAELLADLAKDLYTEVEAPQPEDLLSGENRTLSDTISQWNNGVFAAGVHQEQPIFMDQEQDILKQTQLEPPALSDLTSLYTPPSTEPPSRVPSPKEDPCTGGQVGGSQAAKRHRHVFNCVFCQNPFQCFKKEDIRSHYVKFHNMAPKTRAYPCHIADCSFSADNPTHLERHRPVHNKKKFYTCPVEWCGRNYTRRDNLRRHIENAENHPDACDVQVLM